MTSSVDGPAATSAIAALIAQALGGAKTNAAQERRRKAGSKPSPLTPAGTVHVRPSLQDLITAKAEELNPDAPDFRSRALRLVVEASLLQAFGQQLINAPRFQGMVDAVWRDIESSPQLQTDIRAAMDRLIKPSPKRPTAS